MIPGLFLLLFPVLFILHESEEIFQLIPWLRRNQRRLRGRFPKLFRSLYAHVLLLSRRVFAMMALEEFVIVVLVSIYSSMANDFYPWLAMVIAFTIHLVGHIVQVIAFRGYIPSIISAVLLLPVVCWMLAVVILSRSVALDVLLICGLAGVAVGGGNLYMLHRLVARSVGRG